MKKGKKYIAVYVHNGQDADLTFMRDTSPRVRRAGYLLYILGTVLDSYASGLELKSDPILAVVSSKGVPLAQILFNDYNDVPTIKYNKNCRAVIDKDIVTQGFLQKLGIQEPEWE